MKRLLPLGFTRAAICRELYLSDGNPDIAAKKLLEQLEREREERETEGAMVAEKGEQEEGGGREKGGKVFAITSIEVSV